MPGILFKSKHHQSQEAWAPSGLLAYKGLLQRLLVAGLDLLFPPRCVGCGRVDTHWCARCQEELEQVPIDLHTKLVDNLAGVACSGIHSGKLQDAVHALKYETPLLAEPLGQRLMACLNQLNWTFDIILPIPLHTNRLAERGYNQSHLLVAYVASCFSLPCPIDALTRVRETRSQVGLDRQQRLKNVADAFRADPSIVTSNAVLLVDDVCTTGATLSACAQAALAAGARTVYGLTVTTAR